MKMYIQDHMQLMTLRYPPTFLFLSILSVELVQIQSWWNLIYGLKIVLVKFGVAYVALVGLVGTQVKILASYGSGWI